MLDRRMCVCVRGWVCEREVCGERTRTLWGCGFLRRLFRNAGDNEAVVATCMRCATSRQPQLLGADEQAVCGRGVGAGIAQVGAGDDVGNDCAAAIGGAARAQRAALRMVAQLAARHEVARGCALVVPLALTVVGGGTAGGGTASS